MIFKMLIFVCGINGFGTCVDSGVAVHTVGPFRTQAHCETEAITVKNTFMTLRPRPFYVNTVCVQTGVD